MKKELLLMFAGLLLAACESNEEPDPVLEEEVTPSAFDYSYTINGIKYSSANCVWGREKR